MPENKRKTSKKYKTTSDIEVPVLITSEDVADNKRSTAPGEYPFTRGVYPGMYREREWTMRQYAGFGTARETNRRFKYLLDQGQTGLSVAFDLATQIGYDSDHPMACGEVGRTGVAVDSLADMEALFDGIPLANVSTSMTINSTAVILLAMYIVVGKKQGVDPGKLAGTVQNDILKEFIARGTYIFPPRPSMRIVTDIFAYAGEHLGRYNSISISGYHIREAGSTAAQEIAFTLANGIAYVEAALKAGLAIDDFAPRLSFFLAAHSDLFEEVAKFRVARTLWAKIVKERFGAKDKRSLLFRFHTQTGGSTLTAQQPENNVVRTTMQALAAVLGGTQSLHTNAFDEALGLPTEKSAEIALRTQQILAGESGVTATVDPLAGSYYMEYLCGQLEKEVRRLMDEVDSRGGSIACIEEGYFKNEITRAAYEHQKRVETCQTVLVGVNKYQSEQPGLPTVLTVDPELEKKQIAQLAKMRAERDAAKVTVALDRIRAVAQSDENIVLPVIEAVEEYATVGEISDVFREIWGEYHENN